MISHSYSGFYIAFEGGEGGGKSTQIERLRDYLVRNFPEREVIVSREPGGPKVSEAVRQILLHTDLEAGEMHPRTEALLYAAARSQFLEEIARSALERGAFFLADRCSVSSDVYQGKVRGLGQAYIRKINEDLIAGLSPDLIFFFDLDPEIGLVRREASGKSDRLDKEGIEFHRRVREGYLEIVRDDPDRFVVIEATLSREEQAEIISGKISRLILDKETEREVAIRRERE